MNELKKELLMEYIKVNVAPILVDFISGENIRGAVILPSNIDIKELNGHYEGTNFLPPKWFTRINDINNILVIEKIDGIPKKEQLKFYELLKYRKISTFELPKNTVIIVTANEINKNRIDEVLYSLVAHI